MNKYQRINEIRTVLRELGFKSSDYNIEFPTVISVVLTESGEKKLDPDKKSRLDTEKITLKTS